MVEEPTFRGFMKNLRNDILTAPNIIATENSDVLYEGLFGELNNKEENKMEEEPQKETSQVEEKEETEVFEDVLDFEGGMKALGF